MSPVESREAQEIGIGAWGHRPGEGGEKRGKYGCDLLGVCGMVIKEPMEARRTELRFKVEPALKGLRMGCGFGPWSAEWLKIIVEQLSTRECSAPQGMLFISGTFTVVSGAWHTVSSSQSPEVAIFSHRSQS